MNILIADDSKFMRTILKAMLNDMGFLDIYEAANGWEAIRKTYMVSPDVIFMNLVMPEMDGFEASRQILGNDTDAKIIIVTSEDYSKIEHKINEMKIRDCITLPINEEKLRAALSDYEGVLEKS
ncbi:MAG: response regulator [Deltaproteobacteria bacterium]